MKNLFLLLFTFAFGNLVFAQSEEFINPDNEVYRRNTFMGPSQSFGIYLGFGGDYNFNSNAEVLTVGSRVGFITDNKIDFSIAGYALASDPNGNWNQENNNFIAGSYGGFRIEPILFGNQKINLSIPVFLGGGAVVEVAEVSGNNIFDCYNYSSGDWDGILVAQPGIRAIFKLNNILHFEIGGDYRFTSNISLENFSSSNLNGLSLGAGLKIGFFNFRNKNKIDA